MPGIVPSAPVRTSRATASPQPRQARGLAPIGHAAEDDDPRCRAELPYLPRTPRRLALNGPPAAYGT
jgi:hypothetical protein